MGSSVPQADLLFCAVSGTEVAGNAAGCDALKLKDEKEDYR
jgi:hypothetical protein